MIQRKQTLWLLLAALFDAGLFFFNIYTANSLQNGVNTVMRLHVSDHYPMLLMTLIIIALPLVAILMFKNRKRQSGLAWYSLLANVLFIAMLVMRVSHIHKKHPEITNGNYSTGAILPAVAVVFLILAIIGIRRDSKLVHSQDRLR